MTRLPLALAAALLATGCVVVPARGPTYDPAPPGPPEPSPAVWYYGPHFIAEAAGGGWCYEEGEHTHDYFPDRPEAFVVERGYYTYAGRSEFTYIDGHPLPGGGWCFLQGPHVHEYYPPPRVGFVWRPGRGFFYGGEYRPHHPPPPAFWPRPYVWHREAPPPRLPAVTPPRPFRPGPRPAPPPRPADRDHLERDGRPRREEPRADRTPPPPPPVTTQPTRPPPPAPAPRPPETSRPARPGPSHFERAGGARRPEGAGDPSPGGGWGHGDQHDRRDHDRDTDRR